MSSPPLTAPPAPPGRPLSAGDRWLLPVLRELLAPETIEWLCTDDPPSLWHAAIERGLVDEAPLLWTASRHAGVPCSSAVAPLPTAAELLEERWARRFRVVPLGASDGQIDVATADPFDIEAERAIAFATGRRVRLHLASPYAIAEQLDRLYGGARGEWGSAALVGSEPTADVEHLGGDTEGAPEGFDEDSRLITPLVDRLLADGVQARASDVHIEPEERGVVVRHRVDGVLRDVTVLPRGVAPGLASRIKILSGLDIADRLRPQDGRARVAVNGRPVDLRISTLPAARGEKIVVRILDARTTILGLDEMGFGPSERARLATLLQVREGLILLTGPTGSGKTTTLYAAVREITGRGVNVVTVEDPVEYRIPGIVQVQVHERSGLTFAAALRSIMRQDPDVILVGEIRDRETAEIAIQASLTGHLVLSTLHTNDAASAITRLMDIGVERHKIGTALKGVVAQRLLRRLCPACATLVALGSASHGLEAGTDVGEARGCAECAGTGYAGRLAIAEVLLGTPEIESLVAAGASAERIAERARASGMGSLWSAGIAHVRRGATSLDELLRVAEPPRPAAREHPDRSSPIPDGAFALLPEFEDPPSRSAGAGAELAPAPRYIPPMTEIKAGTVDVFVIRPHADGWQVLVMQRAMGTRCPGSWETVHGRIEPGEHPEEGAVREVAEETGLAIERLYAICVQPFYLLPVRTMQLAAVFAAFVPLEGEVVLGPEHRDHAWLPVAEARRRFAWPRERQSLDELMELVGSGDAGPLEDVLRVRLGN
ncbi:MAG TPA: ATPase, T2SS/T4P/T4SS family [Gemmatimonadaceae bacterium]